MHFHFLRSKHFKPLGKPVIITITAVAGLLAAAAIALGIWLPQRKPAEVTAAPTTTTVSTTVETVAETTTETEAPTTTATTVPVPKELSFTAPKKTTYTTTESTVLFMGSTVPNTTVTLNGEPVKVADNGGFSVDRKLQPGINTFTFVSGKKTVTYHITYRIEILRSVTPNKEVTLSGGDSIQFQAIGHKEASLSVTFRGQKQTMTPVIDPDDGNFYDGGDFLTYQATYSLPLPAGDQVENLGYATVTAAYNGLTKSLNTAKVLIEPIPQVSYIRVTRDYAETFSGTQVNDLSRPTNAYLPAGTVDQVVKSGSAAGNTYYLLGCGRWVYTKDVELLSDVTQLTNTVLSGGDMIITADASILRLNADWKIPYNLQLLPQNYAAPNAAVPSYAITSQTTDYVDITFHYVSHVPNAPAVTGSPLFSAAAWHWEGGKPVLRLHLKQTGQFYGYSVQWEDQTLCLSFKHPHSASNNPAAKPLSGIRIVLDPGHGGNSSGTYSTIQGYYEKTAALDYSLQLRDKLTALGAQVVMTRTTDVLPDNPTMSTRTAYARGNGTDLLLSIHMNGSKATSASGCTLHYFNEYSYGIAKQLSDAMRTVETNHGVGNRSQVTVWSPFFMARVHDCPAVLIECGFMTNAYNMEKLVDPTYKGQLTDAMVQAVVAYFKGLPTITPVITPTVTTTATTTSSTTTTASTTTTTTGSGGQSNTTHTSSTTHAAPSSSTTSTTQRKEE